MIDQRLYIDGMLCDIDDSTEINVVVKSNIFTPADKIVSNSSYTVKLPLTEHNRAIIEHAELVGSSGNFAYNTHKAQYFRNGVEIIKNGKATLQQTSEAIEVTLVWGIFEVISELIQSKKTLADLAGDGRIMFRIENEPASYAEALNSDYFLASVDYFSHNEKTDNSWRADWWTRPEATEGDFDIGAGTTTHYKHYNENTRYLHPVVKVTYILEQIAEQFGVRFVFLDDDGLLESLIIPLVGNKANELSYDEVASVHGYSTYFTQYGGIVRLNVQNETNFLENTIGQTTELISAVSTDLNFVVKTGWSGNFKANGDVTQNVENHYLRIIVEHADTSMMNDEYIVGSDKIIYSVGATINDYREIYLNIKGSGKISVERGDKIYFKWAQTSTTGGGGDYSEEYAMRDVWFDGVSIEIYPSDADSVGDGLYFPIMSNLPSISVIDFIKFLATITGTFPRQLNDDGLVELYPYKLLFENVENAIDWTDKVVPSWESMRPAQVAYNVSDFAQSNYYKWREDKKTEGDFNANMKIDNKTLALNRDVITFPFAASVGSNVPIYELTENATTNEQGEVITEISVNYSKCEPRILNLVDDDGVAVGRFDINLQSVIDTKYQDIAKTLQNARVIKERIKIRDVELEQFEEMVPVYLGQYGGYFAVLDITINSSEIAEVQLIQLSL